MEYVVSQVHCTSKVCLQMFLFLNVGLDCAGWEECYSLLVWTCMHLHGYVGVCVHVCLTRSHLLEAWREGAYLYIIPLLKDRLEVGQTQTKQVASTGWLRSRSEANSLSQSSPEGADPWKDRNSKLGLLLFLHLCQLLTIPWAPWIPTLLHRPGYHFLYLERTPQFPYEKFLLPRPDETSPPSLTRLCAPLSLGHTSVITLITVLSTI